MKKKVGFPEEMMREMSQAFNKVMLPRIEDGRRKSAIDAAITAAIKGEAVMHYDTREYFVKRSARRTLTESEARGLVDLINGGKIE